MIVHIVNLIAGMDMGICKTSCLEMISAVVSSRNDSKDYIKLIVKLPNGILRNNKILLKLILGNAIDPARVRQANKNVRDSVFVKMDNYIKLLYSMGKVPLSSFDNIPKENIYNMDQLATNIYLGTTKK